MKLGLYQKIIIIPFLLIFISLVFSQADKKFALDELDFPIVAEATSQSGKPIYYRGEDTPNHVGLYHPPLYIYALATQIKLFGFSENTVRTFGLFMTLLTAFLTVVLGRFLIREKELLFIPIFMALYLTNPYTIANATLPDIDQTILPPLLVGFLILLVINAKDKYLILLFSVLLWSKLTTPLAVIPFALFWWLRNGVPFFESLLKGVKVFGLGALLFLATYWLFCYSLDLNFYYTFDFLLHSFSKGSGASDWAQILTKIQANLVLSDTFFSWILYPFAILFCFSFILVLIYKDVREYANGQFVLSILALFITFFYLGLIAPFGGFFKYPFPVFSLFCLVVSLVLAKLLSDCSKRFLIGLSSVTVLCFLGVLVLQINYPSDHKQVASFITGVYINYYNYLLMFAGVFLLVLAGVVLFLLFVFKRAATVTLCVLFGCVVGLGLGVSRNHALSSYPTKYSYGQVGMDETVEYLRTHLNEGEIIWSMKDVGFYSGNHYIESYPYLFDEDVISKIMEFKQQGVRYFVATKRIGEDNLEAYPKVQQALDLCCELDKVFGNYYIYKAKK